MAEQISRAEGARIVVENRPGGANVIAMEAVARAGRPIARSMVS